ncbi:MAG: DUF4258 domain-containing protein [Chloroflexota bacterium]
MADDELTIFDVERAILTGEIVERQRDRESGEWKYVLVGASITRSLLLSWRKSVLRTNWSLLRYSGKTFDERSNGLGSHL